MAQVIDKDNTLKTICRRCGGERIYLMQWMDPKTMDIVKREIVNCEECEEGFRYGIEDRSRISGIRSIGSVLDNQRGRKIP